MEITLPVRLTEEDVAASMREYCDACILAQRSSSSHFKVMCFVLNAAISVEMIWWGIIPVLFGRDINIMTAIPFSALLALNSAIFIFLLNENNTLKSNDIKNAIREFRNDYSSQFLRTYTLSPEGVRCESKITNSFLHWEEIYHLTEYPSCFTVEISSSKKRILPRRCFKNEQQLRDFRGIVSSNMPASKWSLKGIPLGLSKPDEKSAEFFDDPIPFPDQKNCLYSFIFKITEKESAALRFDIFRFSRLFKILAAFSIYLFGMELWLSLSNPFLWGVIILTELLLVFWLFRVFRKASLESGRTHKVFWLEQTASFFPDRLVIETANEKSELFWNKFSRIKITRAGLLVYVYGGGVNVFPASAVSRIPNRKEFKAFLKSRNIAGRS